MLYNRLMLSEPELVIAESKLVVYLTHSAPSALADSDVRWRVLRWRVRGRHCQLNINHARARVTSSTLSKYHNYILTRSRLAGKPQSPSQDYLNQPTLSQAEVPRNDNKETSNVDNLLLKTLHVCSLFCCSFSKQDSKSVWTWDLRFSRVFLWHWWHWHCNSIEIVFIYKTGGRHEAGHFDWRFINYWNCYCRQILVKICSSCPAFYCWYIPFLLFSTFKQNYKKLGCNSQEEKIKGSLLVRVSGSIPCSVLHNLPDGQHCSILLALLMIVYIWLTTSLCPVNYLFIHGSPDRLSGRAGGGAGGIVGQSSWLVCMIHWDTSQGRRLENFPLYLVTFNFV